jgi:eukaryotic-like serine/threonine-protein kinase
MTPERWRRIDELFDGALRLDPGKRDAWLREACGGDDGLRVQVARLLAQDNRAGRDGFLTPPDSKDSVPDRTGSWHDRTDVQTSPRPAGSARAASGCVDHPSCFAPKAAIAAGTAAPTTTESPDLLRARLRELPLIYILILGMANFWRRVVLGSDDFALYNVDAFVIVALGAVVALLWSRWSVSLPWLRAIELGMVVALAGRIAFVQYRLMLMFSQRDDPMMAQLTMKNVVLLTSIVILTYGLYIPKNWRRAALVVVPLALLPFATLLCLNAQYPAEMGWLWRGWKRSETPRYVLFSFDAMILGIVALGAAFGARTISLLRRQVVEARQLGQYRLRRQIGSGGMGEVYLAEHQLLKRPCALKLIRPESVADRKALERFEREVRITATLSHPNTVEIFDYGRAEDGTYYYVMEYLPGLSFGELVERHGPLPAGRAVYLLRQVCLALREAHTAGLIHRDIKPSNIFAARRGGMDDVAKLLDFGLVRPAATAHAPDLSEEDHILGTPLFMSPEQAMGARELDERSDIYSLGAVAYYLLTGRPPFNEGGAIAVLIAHARDAVTPPSELRSGIPDDLERVVLRCLSKDAADRYQDAESLERALGECGCASDWDLKQASRWWRDRTRKHEMVATVA